MEKLTTDHGKVVKIIMDAVNAETQDGKEGEVQKAFTPLRQISNDSKDVVPEMEADDAVNIAVMELACPTKVDLWQASQATKKGTCLAHMTS